MKPGALERAVRTLVLVALGLWTGGLATLALVVAPWVFRPGVLPTREAAGRLVGDLLARFQLVEFGCALTVLAGTAVLFRRGPSLAANLARVLLPLAMTACLSTYAFWIGPELESLRDAPRGPRFHALHRAYTALAAANLLLGVAGMGLYAGVRSLTGRALTASIPPP